MEDYTLEPILVINEFEEESVSSLELAKKEVERIIQDAATRAQEIIQKERQSFPTIEKECMKKIEEEIRLEREKLLQKTKEELHRISSIPAEKIKEVVDDYFNV